MSLERRCSRWWGPLLAVQLLTRLPVPSPREIGVSDMAGATPYFPLVGALVGGLLAALGAGLVTLGLPPALSALGLVLGGLLLTGALHEDGLADSADGLLGGRDRERALEIMRDSRVGTFGALALIVAMSGRLAALLSLETADWPAALVVAHVVSRTAALLLLAASGPARPEDPGFAARMIAATDGWHLAMGGALALGLCAAVGAEALVALVVGLVVAAAWGAVARRKIGGVTGDVTGAAAVLAEIAALVAMVPLQPA